MARYRSKCSRRVRFGSPTMASSRSPPARPSRRRPRLLWVRRARWQGRAGQSRLNSWQQPRQRVRLSARKSSEQGTEAFAQKRLGRSEGTRSVWGERKRHAAPVVFDDLALDQPSVSEPGEKLGHRGTRDARPARELGARDPLASDGA
jgi:hypothetical protein